MKRFVVPIVAFLVVAGTAACVQVPPGQPSASATPTGPICPVGSWKSTGVSANNSVAGVTITLSGGSDVNLTVGTDGAVKADFTGMKAVVSAAVVAGAQIAGEFTYQGAGTATVALPSAAATASTSTSTSAASTSAASTSASASTSAASTASASAATPGSPWKFSTPANWGDVRLTAKLTKPVALTVIDNVKLSEVTGAQTTQLGNVIDLQPLLRNGEYRCQGNDTLVVTPTGSPASGPTVDWTFARL